MGAGKRGANNGMMLLLIPVLVAAVGGAYYFFFMPPASDSEGAIKLSQTNLEVIWKGLREFQSENYFARTAQSLEQLAGYKYEFYVPKMGSDKGEGSAFSKVMKEYSLVPDPRVFQMLRRDQKEKGGFRCDYTLLSWYQAGLAEEAAIVWDNPGNFQTGGNVLFNNGVINFYRMNPAEYKRFIKGLQTRSDREFVRKKCRDVSVYGFAKEQMD